MLANQHIPDKMKFCIAVFLMLCLHHVLAQERVKLSRFRLDIPFRNTSFTLVPSKTPRLITPFPIPDPFTFPTPRVSIPSLATGRPWESIRDQIIRTGAVVGFAPCSIPQTIAFMFTLHSSGHDWVLETGLKFTHLVQQNSQGHFVLMSKERKR